MWGFNQVSDGPQTLEHVTSNPLGSVKKVTDHYTLTNVKLLCFTALIMTYLVLLDSQRQQKQGLVIADAIVCELIVLRTIRMEPHWW